MLNMVTPEELVKDDDYEEILEDIKDECGKYGEIEGVRIPRPVPKSKKWEPSDSAAMTVEKNRKADEAAGVGRVYVMYRQIEGTQKAMKAIGGRQFAGRTILVASVSEVRLLNSPDFSIADGFWLFRKNSLVLRRRLRLRKTWMLLLRMLSMT